MEAEGQEYLEFNGLPMKIGVASGNGPTSKYSKTGLSCLPQN